MRYLLQPIPTGLYYTPSRRVKHPDEYRWVNSNLSRIGKIYAWKPKVSSFANRYGLQEKFVEADWKVLVYEEVTPPSEVSKLRKALEFYADRKNYDQFGVVHNDPKDCCGRRHHHPDQGKIAREALGKK